MKVQYPGAGAALLSDINQLSRLSGLLTVVHPGLDAKRLLAELRERLAEELDYELEAASQRRSPRRTPATRRSTCPRWSPPPRRSW